jgi:hypothetical protein
VRSAAQISPVVLLGGRGGCGRSSSAWVGPFPVPRPCLSRCGPRLSRCVPRLSRYVPSPVAHRRRPGAGPAPASVAVRCCGVFGRASANWSRLAPGLARDRDQKSEARPEAGPAGVFLGGWQGLRRHRGPVLVIIGRRVACTTEKDGLGRILLSPPGSTEPGGAFLAPFCVPSFRLPWRASPSARRRAAAAGAGGRL